MSSRFPGGGLPSTGGRSNRKAADLPQTQVLVLESLPNKNIVITQVIRNPESKEEGYTKVLLRGVPRFLIDAFDRIQKEGKTMEGLFRKEGNAARMKNSQDVYLYKESVTAPGNTWTMHDVCSLVKRFLRDLKVPLITSDIKTKLFEYAKKHPDGIIDSYKLTILFEPSYSDKGIKHPMPPEHTGTLGFIMRELNKLSQDSSVHQMNVQNLATVFAPTIFRDASSVLEPPKTPKAAHGKTSLALQKSVEENELRIAAMVILIKNSHLIGLPSDFYLSSDEDSISPSADSTAPPPPGSCSFSGAPSSVPVPSWSRSNSLRPTHSLCGAAAVAALPTIAYCKTEKGGSVSGRKIEKRHSVKMAIATRGRTEEKENKDRRRSNSTVRDIFNKIGERVRKRSGERKASSRTMSPPSHSSTSAQEVKIAVTTGRPSLKSSSFLQPLPANSPCNQKERKERWVYVTAPEAQSSTTATTQPQSKQRPIRPPPPAPKTSTTKIERVHSREKKRSPCESRESRRRVSGASSAVTTQPLPRRSITSVRDEPNSILGEEFLNPNHKFPAFRVRRHTAPVKAGLALRRNQPNTVHSGLRGPMRRATMAGADDKENARSLIRVIARRREEGMEEDEYGDEEDDTLTDTNRTMTSGITVVYQPENILEMNHMESRARRANNWKRRRSGGEGGGRGSATSSTAAMSPVGKKMEEANDESAATVADSSKSPGPPPLPLCSPPNKSGEKVGSGRRSSKRSVGREEERREEMEDVEMMPPPPLSAPPIPCPRSSLGGGNSPHFAIPSLPVGRPSSVSSSVAFATPTTSRRPIGPTPQTTDAANSPLGRRGSSASALDSPKFKLPSSFSSRRQMSVGEKEFACSDTNRAAILDANDATELQLHSRVGTRPSVALLRNQNKGMVAARVNLFAAIQTDAQNASMRSSIGSRHSLTGMEESITPRGGPPVGHSIVSNGGSSSSSNRSSVTSHR